MLDFGIYLPLMFYCVSQIPNCYLLLIIILCMPFFIIIIIICLFVSIVINLSIIIENVFLIVPDSNSNGFGQLNPKQK